MCRSAPHLIVAYGNSWDCMIALTQVSLVAPTLQLGTCWAGFVMIAAKNCEAMQEFLGLPEGQACQAAMMMRYPLFEYPRMPLRNELTISWR